MREGREEEGGKGGRREGREGGGGREGREEDEYMKCQHKHTNVVEVEGDNTKTRCSKHVQHRLVTVVSVTCS